MISAPIAKTEIVAEANKLLASLDGGLMSETAYDTAWVARVPNPDNPAEPLFPAAFDWLLKHQHPDGSWGGELPFPHDRVISTTAALVALASAPWKTAESELALRRGIVYLNRNRRQLDLQSDAAETVGFELLLPELARQAQALGLSLPYEDWAFVEAIKADKLRRIPPIAVYGGATTLTTSLEYLGDGLVPVLADRCQASNGSFGGSPSATAYVLSHMHNAKAQRYLHRVASLFDSGGAPSVYPFDVTEISCVLYYLEPLRDELEDLQPHLERLKKGWSDLGASWTKGMVPNSDDTAVVMRALALGGGSVDTDIFRLYEADDHFHCFPFERNPSPSANAHILETLRLYPSTAERRRMTLKLVHYLGEVRREGRYWIDKWHASPFYATNHAIKALAGLANELVRPAVQWMLEAQHDDGSWGFGEGTAEETALVADALSVAGQADAALASLVQEPVRRGVDYVVDHLDESPPALWIVKGLYTPVRIVRAILVGALYRSSSFLNRVSYA